MRVVQSVIKDSAGFRSMSTADEGEDTAQPSVYRYLCLWLSAYLYLSPVILFRISLVRFQFLPIESTQLLPWTSAKITDEKQKIDRMLLCIHSFIHSFIQSFIRSGYFYSASSSPLLYIPRGIPDTARILC